MRIQLSRRGEVQQCLSCDASVRREVPRSCRRGAVLVMVALMTMMLIGLLAIAVDFSRAYSQKNEMQTSADAASLSGVLSLAQQDTLAVTDTAIAIGRLNKVQTFLLGVGEYTVTCGDWDDDTRTFTAAASCGKTQNAVQVVARDSVNYLFKDLLSITGREQTANAIAWLGYIEKAPCVKPWAIRYTLLTKTLQPSNTDTLRVLTDYDMELLATLPRAQRRFMLKSGSPPTDPGNFGSLDIPNDEVNGDPYEENIATCNKTIIGPGDTVMARTGNMVGPTKQGSDDFCQPRLTPSGECQNGEGEVGMLTVAALWSSELPEVNGKKPLIIEQLVSFSLDTVTSQAEIIGAFIPGQYGGSVGPRPSTITRPVLVK